MVIIMKMKKLALLLAIAMLVVLFGCTGGTGDTTSPSNPPPVSGQPENTSSATPAAEFTGEKNVRVGVSDILSEAAPWSMSNAGRQYTVQGFYQVVCERDKFSGDLVKVLASDITQLDDYTYRVTFFDNIYDSAGNHFTASDALFSINGCKADNNVVVTRYIESCELVSEYVIDITMNTDAFYQFGNTMAQIYMITEAAYNTIDDMSTNPVGTGPYVMEDFVSGSHLTLRKRDDYWGEALAAKDNPAWYWHAANVDTISYQLIKESAQMIIALETGMIDIAQSPSADDCIKFFDKSGFTVWQHPDFLTFVLSFNCDPEKSDLSNILLRQAICYAIDVQGCIDGVGGFDNMTSSFGTPEFSDYLKKWDNEDYYRYDVEKAKQLLTESGFDTSKTIRLMSPNIEKRLAVAQIIQGYLLQIGLNVEIQSFDNATYNSYRYDPNAWDIKLQIAAGECMPSFSADFLSLKTGKDGKNNSFFTDNKLQELIDVSSTLAGHTDENVDAYHQHVKENAYGYGLFSQTNFKVTVDGITELPMNTKFYVHPNACSFAEGFFK